ncbi:MAG: hypothetical protein NVS4B2_28310 [Chloroflexota bacterium]
MPGSPLGGAHADAAAISESGSYSAVDITGMLDCAPSILRGWNATDGYGRFLWSHPDMSYPRKLTISEGIGEARFSVTERIRAVTSPSGV